MLDEDRILGKLSELDDYLAELAEIRPESFDQYESNTEKRRGCERLLQISIECVIDVASLLVKGLKLGLPADEDDIFIKLEKEKVVSREVAGKLKSMKGFRNILVHRYGTVDDQLTYKYLTNQLGDFKEFKKEVIQGLGQETH